MQLLAYLGRSFKKRSSIRSLLRPTRPAILIALTSLLVVELLSGLISYEVSPHAVQAATDPDLDYYEQRVVELTNAKRASFNLPPLRLNRELSVAARDFSRDSVVNRPAPYCGHLSTDGVYPDVRDKRAGYHGFAGAENCFCGFVTPEQAVEGWFNETPPNDGHRRNLLNPDSREIGVGYYLDSVSGRGYVSQDFGQDPAYSPVVINADAPVTASPNVNLYIYGKLPNSNSLYGIGQPVQMRISNRPDFSGATWETYEASKNWTLDSTTTGFKNVYVELKDSAGKSQLTTDNIYYGSGIPYGHFDSLAQASTHLENFTLNLAGVSNAGKPFMQFSPGWGLNSQDAKLSLNWGQGSSVNDPDATYSKAFQLRPSGSNESNAWVYTTSYLHNLPSQVYFRLKLSSLSASHATIHLTVDAAGTQSTLNLTASSFKTANLYQEFGLSFTQSDNVNNPFLSLSVGFTDPDAVANLNIDRMDFYTAPEAVSSSKSWSAPDSNYRGANFRVRFTNNAATNPDFSEALSAGAVLPPTYNPSVSDPPTASPTTLAAATPATPVPTTQAITSAPPPNTTQPITINPTSTPATTPPPATTPLTSGSTPAPAPAPGNGYYTPQPATTPDPAFSLVWARTDDPVKTGVVKRSWMWGDRENGFALLYESYDGRQRLVQYHDKSRMEINNPSGDRNDLFFVTNGLLVREMISGQMQTGDNTFVTRTSAQVPVAGDPVNPNAPTYASFQNLIGLDKRATNRTRQGVTTALARDGSTRELGASLPASVSLAYYDNNLGHNIPDVFWNFMNSRGPVLGKGGYHDDTVIDWVYAMGYPISEPYWTRSVVGGVEKDVLVQVYERRVLTYTPSNPVGFQVEMGNVGQHYHLWRYGF